PGDLDPTRYLAAPVQRDPRTLRFGCGRRVCPGPDLVEMLLFTCIAMTLTVFDVNPGPAPPPAHEYTSGTIRWPPYGCDGD
ncbi:hypothetical protein DFH09DRAFT_906367, partial [Mycena vulgaris]